MIKKLHFKWLLLLLMLVGVGTTAWAEDKTITLDYNSFGLTSSYAMKTATVDGYSFTVDQGYKGTGNTIQMNSSKGSGILYNTKAIPGLKSITVNVSSGNKTYTITTGSFEKPTANSQTGTTGGTYNAASGDTYFQLKVSGASYFSSIVITYDDASVSDLEDSDFTLTGAPVALSFDLFDDADAKAISYTTSSTGAVTVNASEYVEAVVNEIAKTITVTPSKKTSGPVEITVNQEADDTYKAGSATFTVSIDDSTPFTGGNVTFDATTDKGTSPLTKSVVTFTCNNGLLNNGSEYRLYKNSSTVFSLSEDAISDGYIITNITFTGVSGNPASGFATQDGWTTDENDGTWTGEATSVSFAASGAQVRATQIVVTVEIAAPKVLSSIALSGEYPTNFHVGDTFSHEGMIVTASYEGDKTADVTAEANFAGYDMDTAGEQTVTVSYTEGEITKSASYNITVNAPASLISISLSGTYPIEFQQGDTFSSEGIVVTANYDDETTKDVTEEAIFSGYDTANLGQQTVTVTYEGKTATYVITVVEKKGTEDNPYTVAEAIAYIKTLGSSTSADDVYVSGIVSQVDSYNSNYKSITYWISDDGTTTGQMEVYSGKGLDGADFSAVTDLVIGDIVTVKGKVKMYNTTPEFDKNNQLVSITHSTVTSITVNPTTVSLAANDTEGEFTYTINNPIEGTTLTAAPVAEWISNITVGTDKVTFNTTANEGAERAATITLTYGTLTKNVTVTQAKYVADYATLPFSFDGGRADVEEKDGLTQEGLDKDYNSSPKMKFDSAEDCVILKLNEAPRTIEFDIKGNTFSGGTFKVQTSADGETYSDMATYTELGNTETVILYNGNSDVRYIKWVYTVKSSGNVALGNIKVTNTINKHISNAGYATLYVPCALDFSGVSGLTAYTASLSESEVSFSSVANVAANTGVLLKGAEGTYAIPVASSSNNNTSALVGVNVATEVEGAGIFVLMKGEQGVGFYKTNNAFTVGAHTAYIPALSDPSRNFIAFDEATAIKAIESKQQSGEIYNLAGQRVKSAQKGLYIINGKKVVIK